MLNIIGHIITGFIIGLIARAVYPGAQHLGLILTTVLGVGGSVLAGAFTTWRSGQGFSGGVNQAGCLASIVGALVLLFVGSLVFH